MGAFGCLTLVHIQFQVIRHVDAAYDQDLAVELDFAFGLRPEPAFMSGDVTRFQRAS